MDFHAISGVHFPKTKAAHATFNALVFSAERMFGKNGYFNTTVNDITSNAGIATGTFYIYFESKYTIYEWVLTKYQMELRAQLSANTQGCRTRYEKERAGLKTFLLTTIQDPLCYQLVWESMFINPDLFKAYFETFSNDYMRAMKRSSEQISTEDYKSLAYMLMGINNFLGLKVIFDKATADNVDEIVDTAMHVLKDGMFKN